MMRGGANLPLVSSYNRGVVLDTIRTSGELSRVELAGMTGLTAPSVSNIVRRLMAEGYVVEAGQSASTGGKPRTLLRVNPWAGFAVGVQVDAEATTSVLVDLAGEVLERRSRRGGHRSAPATVMARIAADVEDLVAQAGVERRLVIGVGVAVPGPIDHHRGVVLTPPNLPAWHDVALRDQLEELLPGLPVLVDNDATVAVMGERWVGGADAATNFACIYMGAGIGAGIFVDGQVYRGSSSNAGEIGHISLDVDGEECFCGNRGCLELFAAPRSIVAAARRHASDFPGADTALQLSPSGRGVRADHARIARAASAGVPYAVEAIERSARYLALGVVTLVNLFDLELLVLAGQGFAHVGERYVAAVRRELATRSFARANHDVQVRLSPIADDVGAVGAASMVLHSEFAPQMHDLRSLGRHA
jgi:predicted NBD/HSP70 family sugar kinase